MKNMLTLCESGRYPDETGQVYKYVVIGMPQGDEAFIHNAGCPNREDWRIQWIRNGVQRGSTDGYLSAAEALAALKRHVDAGIDPERATKAA